MTDNPILKREEEIAELRTQIEAMRAGFQLEMDSQNARIQQLELSAIQADERMSKLEQLLREAYLAIDESTHADLDARIRHELGL